AATHLPFGVIGLEAVSVSFGMHENDALARNAVDQTGLAARGLRLQIADIDARLARHLAMRNDGSQPARGDRMVEHAFGDQDFPRRNVITAADREARVA